MEPGKGRDASQYPDFMAATKRANRRRSPSAPGRRTKDPSHPDLFQFRLLRPVGLLVVLLPYRQVQEKVVPAWPVQANVWRRLFRSVRRRKREHIFVFLPVVLSTLIVLLKVTILVLQEGKELHAGHRGSYMMAFSAIGGRAS